MLWVRVKKTVTKIKNVPVKGDGNQAQEIETTSDANEACSENKGSGEQARSKKQTKWKRMA